MTIEMIALSVAAVISIVVPLIILGIVIAKNKAEWKRIIVLFFSGAGIYFILQWGLKEHALTWIFNNTGFMTFMNEHYIPYLLIIALIGAGLMVLPQILLLRFVFCEKVSFAKVVCLSVGYSMLESTLLLGYRSINTIIQLVQNPEMRLDVSAVDLFLSGYERILMTIIEMAIVVTMFYFIKNKMTVKAGLIGVVCQTVVTFLPGFFIAFSLTNYYEVYSKNIALILVYVVLTMMAISAIVVLRYFNIQLND